MVGAAGGRSPTPASRPAQVGSIRRQWYSLTFCLAPAFRGNQSGGTNEGGQAKRHQLVGFISQMHRRPRSVPISERPGRYLPVANHK